MRTDDKKRPARVSIYLNDVLVDLQDDTKKSGKSFSYRIGAIVNQYQIILAATPLPTFDINELEVIGNAISGTQITNISVKYLAESVEEFMNSVNTDAEIKESLLKKLEDMDTCQKIKLIDKIFGYN